jgi:hypothetical protein
MNPNALELRSLVRGAYNIQKLRIATGQRIVNNFKVKLGIAPSKKEDGELDAKGKEILAKIKVEYKKMTDAVVTTYKKFVGIKDGLITTFTELCLVDQYMDLETNEAKHFRKIEWALQDQPFYVAYLQHVKGIGPAIAGIIMSTIDIHQCKYPSSVHKYAGYDVAFDGQGRSRRKEHLIQVDYINKDEEPDVRDSITFNPWLKTKLRVTAESFLRCGSPYRVVYDNYKNRIENMPIHDEKSDGHRHAMAMRYMIKIFLTDLYVAWRTFEGLPVSLPYHEAKLGLSHHDPITELRVTEVETSVDPIIVHVEVPIAPEKRKRGRPRKNPLPQQLTV